MDLFYDIEVGNLLVLLNVYIYKKKKGKYYRIIYKISIYIVINGIVIKIIIWYILFVCNFKVNYLGMYCIN